MTKDKVGVVVLNYNGYEDTSLCVRSIAALVGVQTDLILVDNCSPDGSGEKLKKEFPLVEFLSTAENKGYTGGNNLGIRLALERGAEFVHILNNDTVVINENYLAEMLRAMKKERQLGLLGPRVYLSEVGHVQNTILSFPFLRRVVLKSARRRIVGDASRSGNRKTGRLVFVEAVNGVCLLLRGEMLRQVGLFDEGYFMYCEEQDLAYRAKCKGWLSGYLDVESIIHHQKGKGELVYDFTYRQNRVNQVRFMLKHGSIAPALVGSVFFLLGLLWRTVRSPKFRWEDFVSLSSNVAKMWRDYARKESHR